MHRPWLRNLIVALAALGVGLAVVTVVLRRRERLGPDGVVDSAVTARSGSPDDRGTTPRLGIDIEGLREVDELEPTVEYLTYIQNKRGSSEHLLFVRHEDLDAIAALEGQELEEFLQRLDHLGVVISSN